MSEDRTDWLLDVDRRTGKLDGRQMVVVDGRRYKPDTVANKTKARSIAADGDVVGSQAEDRKTTVVVGPSGGAAAAQAESAAQAAAEVNQQGVPADVVYPSSVDEIKALEYGALKVFVEEAELQTPNKKKGTYQAALAAHLGLS